MAARGLPPFPLLPSPLPLLQFHRRALEPAVGRPVAGGTGERALVSTPSAASPDALLRRRHPQSDSAKSVGYLVPHRPSLAASGSGGGMDDRSESRRHRPANLSSHGRSRGQPNQPGGPVVRSRQATASGSRPHGGPAKAGNRPGQSLVSRSQSRSDLRRAAGNPFRVAAGFGASDCLPHPAPFHLWTDLREGSQAVESSPARGGAVGRGRGRTGNVSLATSSTAGCGLGSL